MSTIEEENEALVRQLFEAKNTRDRESFLEVFADEFTSHFRDTQTITKEQRWEGFKPFLEIFPDGSFTLEHVAADADIVACRWRFTGSHEGGEFYGVSPTGKEITITGHAHFRFEDGQVVEKWLVQDQRQLLATLDLIPESWAAARIQRQVLEVLLRVLRHNVSNDLNAITGQAELIEGGDVPADEYAGRIQKMANQLQASAEKVRDIERAVVHHQPARPIDLAELLGTVLSEMRDAYPESQIEVELPEGNLTIGSIRDVLSMVLEEAIENAIIHTEKQEPVVEVELTSTDDELYAATLSITDNGPGIPDHELKPVERGSEDPLEHGSGVGLWAIKWGVDRLHGEVEFDRNDSNGSIVRLHLGDMESTGEFDVTKRVRGYATQG